MTFNILVLLTNGTPNDIQQVQDLINNSLDLPLFIIIVGVGSRNFSRFTEFSQPNTFFVKYRQFLFNPEIAIEKALSQIPEPLLSYMRKKGIKPNLVERSLQKPKPSEKVIIDSPISVNKKRFE